MSRIDHQTLVDEIEEELPAAETPNENKKKASTLTIDQASDVERRRRANDQSKNADVKKRESFLAFVRRMLHKFSEIFSQVSEYAWRFAEFHIYKLIVLSIALFCLARVNLLNLVLLVLLLISLFIDKIHSRTEKNTQLIFSAIAQIWVALFTICSMFFQLKVVTSPLVTNCTVKLKKKFFLL